MKKIISITLSVILAGMAFVGCTPSNNAMKDGTYRAEMSEADSHGWTDFVEITVSGEKITAVDYDSLDADGNRKSESPDYDEAMKGAGSTTYPSKFMPELEAALVEKQDATKVDAIAGATQSSDSFKLLVKELKGNMSSGKTDVVKVKPAA